MNLGTTFRELHRPGEPFILANAWDPGTGKLFQSFGFKAIGTTSAGFAFSRGLSDGEVGFEQMIAHCKEMVAATPQIPVSGDLEKGKGDSAESAGETIFAAEAAGLDGCSIEDFSGDPQNPIYEFSHALERVQSAVGAARALKRDFVFCARAENFLWGRPDLDDTIRRLRAFGDAGADVLYAPGLATIDQVRTVCSAVGKPVNVLASPAFTVGALAQAGVARISLGSSFTTCAFGALERAADATRNDGSFAWAADGMSFDGLQSLFSQR